MTYIYHIPYPADFESDQFAGIFAGVDMEGMEEKETELNIYLSDEQTDEGEVFIREVCQNFNISYSKSELENKNWNEQWESNFQSLLIEDFVLVRTSFHPENPNVKHQIIIEPKMSFGTGHHPTTAQMMLNMRLLNLHNKRVLDCGSGTGILSILAEKSGARSCIALDNDEWCFRNCIENMELNNCKVIQPEIGDLENVKDFKFDCILANIHRNFLTENMAALAHLLTLDGYLLVSGFYSEDAKIILDAALEYHLIATYHTSMENWDGIVFQKNMANI